MLLLVFESNALKPLTMVEAAQVLPVYGLTWSIYIRDPVRDLLIVP